MKRALVLINAYLKLKSQFSQAQRLQEELSALGIQTDIMRNDGFFARIESDGTLCSQLPEKYDFCVYFDKDKYMSEMLEKSGVRLFNNHEAIRVCDDKMQTYIALSKHGVKMPKTLSGLLCYEPTEAVKEETLARIEQTLAYPVIVKECFGSLGKGVFMARNRAELTCIAERVKCKPHLFQETVQTSIGRDVRVIVVGGKVLCAMLRQSDCDFRSNIELGGTGYPYQPSEKIIALCEKAASILGLDYCGIDILFGERNEPILCEVNSNAFFGGIERVTGVNVAKAYAEYIYECIYGKGTK